LPRTILVVDNNAFYRQVLGDFFKGEGFQVALAGDGVEALERIAAGGVDMVILDLIMPRIDGARLCRFLKSHPVHCSLPVIILSGILADEIEGIESINADAYVAKMPMDQLQQMLRSVLAKLQGAPTSPVIEGFEKMYRREVVLELLVERRARDLILNSISEGLVEMTSDRRILRTNQVFEEMVDRSAGDLLSMRLADLFPEAASAIEALFETMREGGSSGAAAIVTREGRSLRLRLHRLDAESSLQTGIHPTIRKISVENPKVRLVDPGTLPGFILLLEDVTEMLRAQTERERFKERLARSERMSALGMFVGGAAHELNNPLTAVLGYAQLLAGKPLPGDVKASLKRIEEGAARCKAIVENLLLYGRNGRPERHDEQINALVLQAVAECGEKASAGGVSVRTDLDPSLPEIPVNGGEITQAVYSIVDNAVHAARVGTAERTVRVRTFAEGDSVVVEVADSGSGIPESILGRIFDPFFSTREVGEGKGLGLSIAYGIMRGHQGCLGARNVPGSGACLTLRIPGLPAGAGASAASPARTGGRILIVDDEPVVLELLSEVLGAEHEIETAGNGREGLAKAGKGGFDLILLDIKMPDMTGRQMYEALLARRPEIAERVIFTTGDSVQEDTRLFLDSVGNPCITKPFSIDSVTEIVDRVLAVSRSR